MWVKCNEVYQLLVTLLQGGVSSVQNAPRSLSSWERRSLGPHSWHNISDVCSVLSIKCHTPKKSNCCEIVFSCSSLFEICITQLMLTSNDQVVACQWQPIHIEAR